MVSMFSSENSRWRCKNNSIKMRRVAAPTETTAKCRHLNDFHLNFKSLESDVIPRMGIKPNSWPNTSVCDIDFRNDIRRDLLVNLRKHKPLLSPTKAVFEMQPYVQCRMLKSDPSEARLIFGHVQPSNIQTPGCCKIKRISPLVRTNVNHNLC